MSDFKPLFIVGFPRSGTTLLLHIIRASQEYPSYDFDETHYYSHYYLRYGNLSKLRQRRRLLEDITMSAWFRQSGLGKQEFLNKIDEDGLTYHGALSSFMELIATKQGKTRWLEKTPWHILYLNEIAGSYPSAKFIYIVRDPRSVVLSVHKAGWATGITKNQLRVAAAWRWHDRLAEKRFSSMPDRYLCVRV